MAQIKRLSEEQIVQLSSVLTMRDMKTIALSSLGTRPEFLTNLKDTDGNDSNAFNREIIRPWCFGNHGIDQVTVSYVMGITS